MTTNDEPTPARTRAGALPWKLLVLVVAVCVALSVGLFAVAAQSASLERNQQAAEAARAEAREAWAKEVAAAEKKAAREAEAARKEAARERAERVQAAREEAAREKAAREKAAREKAAREQAAREKAAREKAAREQAAREEAARERAEQAASKHEISGEIAVSDINGALVTQVGGYPGQAVRTLTQRQLDRLGSLVKSLKTGKTYPCPAGAGGGYADLAVGTQVTVKDGSGKILATSSLTGGRVTMHGCVFTYSVSVPAADFYQVEVAHRGALTFSQEELAANDWQVSGRV